MKIRTVLMALVATAALSGAALAADANSNAHNTNHPSGRAEMTAACSALETQYDGLVAGGLKTPKAGKIEGLHARGVDACESNNSDIGVQKLQQAVRDLGAKPAA